jgi:CubicO group peptidase (beta-lactamase class C family)
MRAVQIAVIGLMLVALAVAQEAKNLRDYMAATEQIDNFSGTVLVTRNGKIVLQHASGLADRGKQLRNTVDTSFRIGSMTKSITATAIMILVDRQGPVRIGDSVCGYLKPCPEKWTAVRVEHLLTHTAGMPDIVKFPDFMELRMEPHTSAQLVEKIASKPLDFTPGSKFVYSNSNFLVLGAVIERVSGVSYDAFLNQRVFGPAGMKSSGYEVIAGRKLAKGYVREGSSFREADKSETSVRFSAGGLYSSAPDLLRFVRALATGRILGGSMRTNMASGGSWTTKNNGAKWDTMDASMGIRRRSGTFATRTFSYAC